MLNDLESSKQCRSHSFQNGRGGLRLVTKTTFSCRVFFRAQEKMFCSHCGAPTSLKCGTCKLASYCSKECQQLHWQQHKKTCLADFEDIGKTTAMVANIRKCAHRCDCEKCRLTCHGMPGPYDPVQVREFVKNNPDFYGTCVQDYYAGDGTSSTTFFLRPPTISELPGTRARFLFKDEKCKYLTETGCSLAENNTMPTSCLVTSACRKQPIRFDKQQTPAIWGSVLGLAIMKDFETYNTSRSQTPLFPNLDQSIEEECKKNPIEFMLFNLKGLAKGIQRSS